MRRWIAHFKCDQGLLHDVLRVLEADVASATSPLYKLAVLSFDEMDVVQKKYQYCSRLDSVVHPCKKVQVAMIRGLTHQVKTTCRVYFAFDQAMTKKIFLRLCVPLKTLASWSWPLFATVAHQTGAFSTSWASRTRRTDAPKQAALGLPGCAALAEAAAQPHLGRRNSHHGRQLATQGRL